MTVTGNIGGHRIINNSIPDTKLKTPLTSQNLPLSIVVRDGSGDFSARDLSGRNINLSGNLVVTGTSECVFNGPILAASAPTVGSHLANKSYVDSQVASVAGSFASNTIINETPSGVIDGTNRVFTLTQIPLAGTITLVVSGIVLTYGTHFTVSGNTITYVAGFQPQAAVTSTYPAEWHKVSFSY